MRLKNYPRKKKKSFEKDLYTLVIPVFVYAVRWGWCLRGAQQLIKWKGFWQRQQIWHLRQELLSPTVVEEFMSIFDKYYPHAHKFEIQWWQRLHKQCLFCRHLDENFFLSFIFPLKMNLCHSFLRNIKSTIRADKGKIILVLRNVF